MIRFFLILLFLFSCSKDSVKNSSGFELVKHLIVDVDRTADEIYIQAETSPFGYYNVLSDDYIPMYDSVIVDLEYLGGEYSYESPPTISFLLYDNGSNGDLISNNGVYTLIDIASKLPSPDEISEITSVDFPTYFELDDIDNDAIEFSITIKGKKYFARVFLYGTKECSEYSYRDGHCEEGELFYPSAYQYKEYIDIDNTELEVQINKSLLYIDDDVEGCNRILGGGYQDVFYPITFDWPDAESSGLNDYFIYESGFSVSSMSNCASTGVATFRFILNDLDTGESSYEDRSIIIFGCGDNICHNPYENINSCPEDCLVE